MTETWLPDLFKKLKVFNLKKLNTLSTLIHLMRKLTGMRKVMKFFNVFLTYLYLQGICNA